MSERVLVYTDDSESSRCTVVLLRHNKIAFRQVDTTGNPKLIATLIAAGHKALPVVMVGNEVWTGYRPEKIKALRVPSLRVGRGRRSA